MATPRSLIRRVLQNLTPQPEGEPRRPAEATAAGTEAGSAPAQPADAGEARVAATARVTTVSSGGTAAPAGTPRQLIAQFLETAPSQPEPERAPVSTDAGAVDASGVDIGAGLVSFDTSGVSFGIDDSHSHASWTPRGSTVGGDGRVNAPTPGGLKRARQALEGALGSSASTTSSASSASSASSSSSSAMPPATAPFEFRSPIRPARRNAVGRFGRKAGPARAAGGAEPSSVPDAAVGGKGKGAADSKGGSATLTAVRALSAETRGIFARRAALPVAEGAQEALDDVLCDLVGQMAGALSDYAGHAGRGTVNAADFAVLFRRQRMTGGAEGGLVDLLHENLPMEWVEGVIPVARAIDAERKRGGAAQGPSSSGRKRRRKERAQREEEEARL